MAVKKKSVKKAAPKKSAKRSGKVVKKSVFTTIKQPNAKEKVTTVREIIGATEAQIRSVYKKRLEAALASELVKREFAKLKREKTKIQKKISELKRRIKNL